MKSTKHAGAFFADVRFAVVGAGLRKERSSAG